MGNQVQTLLSLLFAKTGAFQPFRQKLAFLFEILPDVSKISCRLSPPLKSACESHVCCCALPRRAVYVDFHGTEVSSSGESSELLFCQYGAIFVIEKE